LTAFELEHLGTVTEGMRDFLRACVLGRLNVVVSGGTGAGKTTLLNVLSQYIPEDERVLSIEDAAELQLAHRDWLRLETRPPNIEGAGAVSARDCVRAALRMRPDRIIVGECRGGEALDMLQAMNTGHDGSLTTVHANSPRDVLSRLETMALMAGMDLPLRAIRQQISSAIDLVVQVARLRDGSRKVTAITEVQAMESDTIVLQDIFVFNQETFRLGRITGNHRAIGVRPKFMDRLEQEGLYLGARVFGVMASD
jgi:pilus assembly protein CpaF